MEIEIEVNGTRYRDRVEPRTLLVHHLREGLGLTGTNVGCDTSNCGACTVLLDGVSVKSCTVLAVQVDGRAVTTIEGLGTNGERDPLQEAFHQEHGLQCGYCTPGMIMAAKSFLAESPDPSRQEIREGMDGNLCRCTGYQNIVNAIQRAASSSDAAAAAPAEPAAEVLAQSRPATEVHA